MHYDSDFVNKKLSNIFICMSGNTERYVRMGTKRLTLDWWQIGNDIFIYFFKCQFLTHNNEHVSFHNL